MTKAALRKDFLNKRLSMTESELRQIDDLLLIRFQQWPIPDTVQYVLSFWPLAEKGEVNSFLFTDYLEFRIPGLQLAYPVTGNTDHSMQAGVVAEDTSYKLNRYGIAEPESAAFILPEAIDLIFAPLLAFDLDGHRLGYGGGYYDRFLAKCSPDAVIIGLSQFEPLPEIPGRDEFDVPLTVCITTERIYEF